MRESWLVSITASKLLPPKRPLTETLLKLHHLHTRPLVQTRSFDDTKNKVVTAGMFMPSSVAGSLFIVRDTHQERLALQQRLHPMLRQDDSAAGERLLQGLPQD